MDYSLNFLAQNSLLISVLIIWSLLWKGIALWKAARKEQASWFIIILLVNTLSLLDIAYIFYLYRYDIGSRKLLNFFNEQLRRFDRK